MSDERITRIHPDFDVQPEPPRPLRTPVLFLGGPWHGHREPVRLETSHDVHVPLDTTRRPESSLWEAMTCRYALTRLTFPASGRVIPVYFPAGWSDADKDDALAAWLEAGA